MTGVRNTARIIIYRINKKGLEVFLVNLDRLGENWQIPEGSIFSTVKKEHLTRAGKLIDLDPVATDNGDYNVAVAVEGDWHDIPTIRTMLKEDLQIVKDQLKTKFPELEQGAFFAVKEAFKKVLPDEYAFLKELKDIVTERNQAKYI